LPARIDVRTQDITLAEVDAIVNPANEGLQLGGGVAGAIRRRGGPSIQEECDRIGHCPTGEAVVTGGGDLPARWVIHAVGPVWRGGAEGEEGALASAVRAALTRAEEIGARSVALPAISAGIFGFPVDRAARISVTTAREFARAAKTVGTIVFCLFDDRARDLFRTELRKTET
jgi:O-acetyl-ADP-ribose deacetylase (regulator of RNase III)